MNLTDHYETLRSYLFAIAYNMTGQIQEAEDLVHDAFADVIARPLDHVRNPKSFLTRVVMNKAIDRLSALKKEREHYPSVWLPEPFITQAQGADTADILPYAFLHLMEELNAVERAVFILREAFDYSYEDIAEVVGVNVENCRQILHRSKAKLKTPIVFDTVQGHGDDTLLHEFLNACINHDTEKLKELLKSDVILYSDGGGKVTAARKIISGLTRVAKFIAGVATKTIEKWSTAREILVNERPAFLMPDVDGVYMILIPHIVDGKVASIFIVRNPEKIFLKKSVTK